VLKGMLTRFLHTIERDQFDSVQRILGDAAPQMIRSLAKLPAVPAF
jgi:hypothetical protein